MRRLGGRAGLHARPLGLRGLVVSVVLDDGRRRLRALTLVEQVPKLLVEALLAPPRSAHPPLVTHVCHLRGSGLE
jgi:hypothetical protein